MKLDTLTARRTYLMRQAKQMADKYRRNRESFYKAHKTFEDIEHFEAFYQDQNRRYRKGITEPQLKAMMIRTANKKRKNEAYFNRIKSEGLVRK